MKKVIKVIAGFLGAVILLVVFAIILLVTLVNPDRFKPYLADQVHKYMGRQLTMEGHLSWSFYPYLGIKAGHIELSNPPSFQQKTFAEVDSITVGVKLIPLLYARIESSGLSFHGLKLNLIRNAAGQTNWQDLQAAHPVTSAPQEPTKTTASKAALVIAITGIDVSNASIHWIDEQAKQDITVDEFDFQAKDIASNRPFPITTQCHILGKNPAIDSQITLSGNAVFDLEKQLYQLRRIDLTMQIKQGKTTLKINSQAALNINMEKQWGELEYWRGDVADIHWKGKLDIKNIKTNPLVTGYLQTDAFALQDVLASLGQKTSDTPKANNVQASLSFSVDTAKKAATGLQKISSQGVIKADDLQLQKIKITNLVAHTQLADGVLNLSSISGLLYQGNLQSDGKIDLNNAVPTLALNSKLSNIQVEPLLTDLVGESKLKFSGVGNVDLQMTTAGTDKNTILQHLNGSGKISVNHGVLKGIDIAYLANSAYAVAKKQSTTMTNTDETQFGDLTATINIQSGVVSNKDLLINMTNYTVNGNGNIDLINQKIDYSLGIKAKKDFESDKNDLLNLYGLTIPVKISGNLDHPSIGLDMMDLTKQIAELQLQKGKEKVQEKVQEQINKALPDVGNKLLKNILGN